MKEGKEGFDWAKKMEAVDRLWQLVQKTATDMHARGYEFEIKNDSGRNEVVVKFPAGKHKTREAHFMATPDIALERNGEKLTCSLMEAVRARILNPDGNLWDTLRSEEFQKVMDSESSRPAELGEARPKGAAPQL